MRRASRRPRSASSCTRSSGTSAARCRARHTRRTPTTRRRRRRPGRRGRHQWEMRATTGAIPRASAGRAASATPAAHVAARADVATIAREGDCVYHARHAIGACASAVRVHPALRRRLALHRGRERPRAPPRAARDGTRVTVHARAFAGDARLAAPGALLERCPPHRVPNQGAASTREGCARLRRGTVAARGAHVDAQARRPISRTTDLTSQRIPLVVLRSADAAAEGRRGRGRRSGVAGPTVDGPSREIAPWLEAEQSHTTGGHDLAGFVSCRRLPQV